MSSSPSFGASEKKHWWLSNRKRAEKFIKDARTLIAGQDQSEIASALTLLDAALSLYPRLETALELKARSLLYLRRFREVANLLQEHIPSFGLTESFSSESSQQLSRERVKLLSSVDGDSSSSSSNHHPSFKCFSVSDLKKKVLAGLSKNCKKEDQWRYLVLGQACSHLGLMEDAMVLLQTGKRLATAANRRESVCWSEDSFVSSTENPASELENINQTLGNIKFLLRRRTAALAALDAGLHSEAIRHFSKILDGRRGSPQGFVAECYMHRAAAFQAAGRISESIADCNRTLALDPTCITALSTRAHLLETVRCFSDCLRDLEHLKLLYDSILRDRKLPGPAWKRHSVSYRDIPGSSRTLAGKIQELKQRLVSGETCTVDYYALIGLRRGCTRSELERTHLLLCLRHRPDKSTSFVDRCELVDDRDIDSVKDQARMSALLLYRLLQKAYSSIMASILDEEAAEKQRQRAVPVPVPVQVQLPVQISVPAKPAERCGDGEDSRRNSVSRPEYGNAVTIELSEEGHRNSVFQGVFCREIAAVGNLLSQGFTHPAHHLSVNYEPLTC